MKRSVIPLFAACLLASGARLANAGKGTQKPPQDANLKPGEYVWTPQAAGEGPLDIIVSLHDQRLAVYRDGVLIGRSTIASGRPGYETPKGVYMILQKNVTHHSNKYHEASMPYMERLTWGGLAIHAGSTPGHPDSHGCMHVPTDFAKDLYGYTQEGNTVLVADAATPPAASSAPDALFAGAGAPTPKPTPTPSLSPAPDASPLPGASPVPGATLDLKKVVKGPYLIVFSTADKRMYVYRQGVEIGRADLTGPNAAHPQGLHVYAVRAVPGKGGEATAWTLLGSGDGAPIPHFHELAKSWAVPADFRQQVRGLLQPGTTLVVTDAAADNTKPVGQGTEE